MLYGLLFIALASTSWGTTGATMTILARDTGIGPLLVGWLRLAVAAPCLVAATLAARLIEDPRRATASIDVTPGALGSYALLGASMAAYQACYFWAVSWTGITVAALIAICSAPLLIALLAVAILRERLPPIVSVSLATAVAGTALLVVGPRGFRPIAGQFGLGALLALGAGVSYAVYAVTAKRVLAYLTPLAVATITFTLGAVFLSPVLLIEHAPSAQFAAGWPWFVYLGVGPTAAAYVLFTAGLRRVPATAAGIVSLLEPLTATLLGVIVFGEPLGVGGAAGAVLLLASLVMLAVWRR